MGLNCSFSIECSSTTTKLLMPKIVFHLKNFHGILPTESVSINGDEKDQVDIPKNAIIIYSKRPDSTIYRYTISRIMAILEEQAALLSNNPQYSKFVRDTVRNWLDAGDFNDEDVLILIQKYDL